jgi:hypothetical protein
MTPFTTAAAPGAPSGLEQKIEHATRAIFGT